MGQVLESDDFEIGLPVCIHSFVNGNIPPTGNGWASSPYRIVHIELPFILVKALYMPGEPLWPLDTRLYKFMKLSEDFVRLTTPTNLINTQGHPCKAPEFQKDQQNGQESTC